MAFWVFRYFRILVYFSVNLCTHYFCDFQKKFSDPNWPYISTSQTKNNKFLSVGNLEFCLSILFRRRHRRCKSVAFLHQLMQLEIFTIKPYFIQDDPSVAAFWLSRFFVWAGRQHCPMSEKINGIYVSFTKLSQSTRFDVMKCQMEGYFKVMEGSLIQSHFFGFFSYYFYMFET